MFSIDDFCHYHNFLLNFFPVLTRGYFLIKIILLGNRYHPMLQHMSVIDAQNNFLKWGVLLKKEARKPNIFLTLKLWDRGI